MVLVILRVLRLLAMLEISVSSRDPDVVALATASDMLVRYESQRFIVSSGMVWRYWKVNWWSLVGVVAALSVPKLLPFASPASRRQL